MDLTVQGLAKLIEQGNIDISKMLFQFNSNYQTYENEVAIQTISKRNSASSPLLVLLQFVQNRSTLLSTVAQNAPWKQFGYKYFTPEDRQFFFAAFSDLSPGKYPRRNCANLL